MKAQLTATFALATVLSSCATQDIRDIRSELAELRSKVDSMGEPLAKHTEELAELAKTQKAEADEQVNIRRDVRATESSLTDAKNTIETLKDGLKRMTADAVKIRDEIKEAHAIPLSVGEEVKENRRAMRATQDKLEELRAKMVALIDQHGTLLAKGRAEYLKILQMEHEYRKISLEQLSAAVGELQKIAPAASNFVPPAKIETGK